MHHKQLQDVEHALRAQVPVDRVNHPHPLWPVPLLPRLYFAHIPSAAHELPGRGSAARLHGRECSVND